MIKKVKLQNRWVRPSNRTSYQKEKYVPELRVSGDWLKINGFEASEMVTIEVEFGKMIITRHEVT